MTKLFCFVIALLASTAAFAADVTPHSLVAGAGSQTYWVAVNVPQGAGNEAAAVFSRALLQDDRWIGVTRFPSRVEMLATQDTAAAALTDDGSWMVIYDEHTVTTGASLPASPRMLAIASGAHDWWAIGEVPGGMDAVRVAIERSRAASQPATRATTTAATRPASTRASLPAQLILFRLDASEWDAVAALTPSAGAVVKADLAIVDNIPYVATYDGAAITVGRRAPGAWVTALRVADAPQVASFKLLQDGSILRLWIQEQDPRKPDRLYRLDNGKTKPLSIAALPEISAKDRTAVIFGQVLRVVGKSGPENVVEQRFLLDTGEPQGKPASILLPASAPLLTLQEIHTAILFTSMLLVFVGWIRVQSAEEDGPEPKPLPIAPLGRRLAAGLIDASPILLTMLFMAVHYRELPAQTQYKQFMLLLAYWASGLFYVLLTTLSEVIGGRTLGKIMLGLKVVDRQGAEPQAMAMLIRNLLRVFDLSLFFLPVLSVVFSSVRQRAGDLAAGTVVIADDEKTEKDGE